MTAPRNRAVSEPRCTTPKAWEFLLCVCLVLCSIRSLHAGGDSPGATSDRVRSVVPVSSAHQPEHQNVYHSDPHHLWNRLFLVFYCRDDVAYPEEWSKETEPERRATRMEPDVLDPPLGIHPRFLLDDKPFTECVAVLDEFLNQHGERLIRDPLKRAVMQRDLWAIFDLLQTEHEDYKRNYGDTPKHFSSAHQEHRQILSSKIATAIRRLALPRKEIEALPNTYIGAVKSKAFSKTVADQSKGDFLPVDLFEKDSPWLEVFFPRELSHTPIVRGRSVFRVFLRPPPDRKGQERSE